MQLTVKITDNQFHTEQSDDENEFVVESFTDVDSIAGRVARVVRHFIRETPVRASRHRCTFFVDCTWSEDKEPAPAPESDAPRPKRKRKARK